MKTQLSLLVATLCLISVPAFAEPTGGLYVGLQGGISDSNNDIGSNFVYGATVGVAGSSPFGVAVYYNRFNIASGSFAGLTASADMQLIGAELNFSPAPDLMIGAKGGAEIASASLNSASTSSTYWNLGPKISYDFKIAPNFSIGAEANYLFKISSDGVSLFEGLGVVKFWL